MSGPLIPGMREFDTPRRRWPSWLTWALIAIGAVAVLVLLGGLFGGVGPLRALGLTTTSLQAVGYRPTTVDTVIQVAVAMPPSGLCRDDDVRISAFERGNRIEVEGMVTRSRNANCATATLGGDLIWVDVELDSALGDRTVIRTSDRAPLNRDASRLS